GADGAREWWTLLRAARGVHRGTRVVRRSCRRSAAVWAAGTGVRRARVRLAGCHGKGRAHAARVGSRYAVIGPTQRALYGTLPAPREPRPHRRLHPRRELAVERPVARNVLEVLPIADRQPRKVGGAPRRGLCTHRSPHGRVQ